MYIVKQLFSIVAKLKKTAGIKETRMMPSNQSWQDKVESALEDLGVYVSWYKQNQELYAECEFYSEAGENFVFSICGNSFDEFKQNLADYYWSFDSEEHAVGWYGANKGEPDSLRVLLADADSINEQIERITRSVYEL